MNTLGRKVRNASLGFCAALVALLAASCSSKDKLAEELNGTWSSAPEQIANSGATRTTMVRVIEFNNNGGSPEGAVTMTALITVDNVMAVGDSISVPLTITASGAATITGVFQAKDDDELLINLDYSSLQVSVDPQAVQLNYNLLTQESSSRLEALRPGALRLATQQIQQSATSVFSNLTEIEDIKIDNNLMSCEIGHKDLTFRRQQP